MRDRKSNGVTLTEALVGLTLGLMILVILWTLYTSSRRTEASVGRRLQAVAHAEFAIEVLNSDLLAMAPPDPYRPERTFRLREDGRAMTFWVTEEAGKVLKARPVLYEARPTAAGHGNCQLYRNGSRVQSVLLENFRAAVVVKANTNPVLLVQVVGVGEDLAAASFKHGELHPLRITVPFPAVSPAALIGMPAAGLGMIDRGIEYAGTLPEL